MGPAVCNGATLVCPFGAAPSTFVVLPTKKTFATLPCATIMDHVSMMNVMPFGLCSSLANPTVAAATSAAMGALTPMPCIPATFTPWAPGSSCVMVGGVPVLESTSTLARPWGGVIQVVNPGQTKTIIGK
jgi:hypothetical protein